MLLTIVHVSVKIQYTFIKDLIVLQKQIKYLGAVVCLL